MDATDALGLPPSRWVDVDGPVHYREWAGPADGPTFVLVHGLGGSLLNWALVAPGLARRGRVVALDLAGFGLTPVEERRPGLSTNWRLLHGFLRALDLPPVVLVGNSMGGMLSLIEAAQSPEAVSSLVLVAAAFPRSRSFRAQPMPWVAGLFTVYASGPAGERLVRQRMGHLGAEGIVRESLRACAADPAALDPILVEALTEQVRARQDLDYALPAFLAAARAIFRSQVAPGRYRALVDSVTHPALVIHGAKDRLVRVGAVREAAAKHPNWTLEVFRDLGHVPQMEAPARFLRSVDAWIDAEGATAYPRIARGRSA